MNYKIVIKDLVTPALRGWETALRPGVLNKAIARGQERLFRDHIGGLPANKLGRSTGFWADAARATTAEPTDFGCVVSVSKLGFRQRYFGGVIKAKPGSYLTIPARSEFYGARARQFTNLRFVLFASGTAALVIDEGGAEKITGLQSSKSAGGKKSAGMVAFWLKKEVHQKGDPTIIPSDQEIGEKVRETVGMVLGE